MTDSFLSLNAKTSLTDQPLTGVSNIENANEIAKEDPTLRKAAEEFEAAFIGQMLKFSGFAEALTKGGGEDVAAFTDFYIESFAEKIVDQGGFGLADSFYDKLAAQANQAKEGILDVRS